MTGLDHRKRSRAATLSWGFALLVFLCSLGLVLAGRTPVPLIVVVALTTAAALSRPLGWVLAVAMTPLGLTALLMVLGQIYPDVGAPFNGGNITALALVGSAALISMAVGPGVRPVPREAWWVALGASSVSVVSSLWISLVGFSSEEAKVAWVMANDSTFSVFSSRVVLLDGGADPDKHPSPAVGIFELIATFTGPGHGSVAPHLLLAHELERVIQGLVLATCGVSVLGALGVALATRHGHLLTRVAVSVVVAALPWTWFLFGNATRHGFWNAIFSTGLLAAAWIAFSEADRHPTAASAAQAVAATALLSLWAPLLLVPALFGVLIVLRYPREHLALRRLRLVVWLVPLLVFVWYLLFVLLPLLDSHGGALGADGAMIAISRTSVTIILLAALVPAMIAFSSRGRGWELVTAAAVLCAGMIGLEYLMSQRAESPSGAWGYYPQKFGWLVSYLAILVAARGALVAALPAIQSRADRERTEEDRPTAGSRLAGVARGGAAFLAPTLVMAVLVAQVPPDDPRPVSAAYRTPAPSPDWRPQSVLPILTLADPHGISELDRGAAQLFELSSPEEKVAVSRFHDDPTLDALVNFWLLQQPLVEDNMEIRNFAYFLDPNDPQAWCDVAQTWGGDVTVVTRDQAWQRKLGRALERRCPEAGLEVVLD